MKSLAAEWAPHRIRVNAIAPGYMDTALNREALLGAEKKHWCAMTPMGRLGVPDELNGLAVFLASDAARFVTGADILADVGFPGCWFVDAIWFTDVCALFRADTQSIEHSTGAWVPSNRIFPVGKARRCTHGVILFA